MTEKTIPPLLRVNRNQPPFWKRVLLIGAAIGCFVLGIFGWLLPVITGIPFYLLGVVLLGSVSPKTRSLINRGEARLPYKWRKALRTGISKVPIRRVRESIQR